MADTEKYKAWCKATDREDSEPRYSYKWAISRRAWFRIYEDRVECGDWKIPFESIEKAIVYKTKQMFIPATVLQLITKSKSYQFGFNPWASPIQHLQVEVEEKSIKLKYSALSIAIRVFLIGYLIYFIYSKYLQD